MKYMISKKASALFAGLAVRRQRREAALKTMGRARIGPHTEALRMKAATAG